MQCAKEEGCTQAFFLPSILPRAPVTDTGRTVRHVGKNNKVVGFYLGSRVRDY